MEITLEKIELVKDRTGVTYKEAKDALEAAEGNVVDAIIAIEDSVDSQSSSKKIGAKGEALIDKVKETVKKGNVSKILVTKDDEIILNIPLNAGIVGVVVGPWVMLLGVVASFGFKCQVSVIKTNGDVIDITDKAGNLYEEAKVKSGEMAGKVKEKAPGVYDAVREKGSGAVNMAVDAAKDAAGKIRGKVDDGVDIEYVVEDVPEEAAEEAEAVVEEAKEEAEAAVEKVDEAIEKAEEE